MDKYNMDGDPIDLEPLDINPSDLLTQDELNDLLLVPGVIDDVAEKLLNSGILEDEG